MRIVYMGTPSLSATILAALIDAHDIVGVFTRPDAIRGRGKKLVASSVKKLALEHGIDVFTPSTLASADAEELLESLQPDAVCVAAYGAILPKSILEIPRFGCLNVHTSLLPRWRGAAPIERSILCGDETTGVCIMKMEEGLDTGPYCVRREVAVGERYLDDLCDELAREGSEGLLEALDAVEKGSATWTPQAEEGVTYAQKIGKGELACSLDDDAWGFVSKVRASSDSHSCRIMLANRRLAVERARVLDGDVSAEVERLEPGMATLSMKRLLLGTRDGIVQLEQVRPDGKKSMLAKAFAAGIQGIKNNKVMWGKA